MKYHCLACNHDFEADAGPKKPRCPRCMSIHDVEPAREGSGPTAPERKGRPSRAAALLFLALAGAAVACYFLVVRDVTDTEEDAPASTEDLLERLGRLGVPAEEAAAPFAVTAGVERLAERLAGGADGREALGKLIDGLGELRKTGRFTAFHQRSLRADPPLTADGIAAALDGTGGPRALSSYELACLLLASARALGLEDARMVRYHSFAGEQRPADPTGRFGRFGVAIGAEGKETEFYEAFELRTGKAARGDIEPLSDTAAVAPFYNERALAALFRRETAAAHRESELAIKLDGDAAAFRVARGLIFIAGGAPDEALAEYEKALKRRPDAVNHVLLADLLMKLGDTQATRAEGEVRAAIEKMPDYAQAHAVLGQIYSMRREFETAESELTLAEKLDPLSPEVAMAWAIYHMVQHDNSEAIERAEQAVRLSGEAVDALLALAGIYRQTARFGLMRQTLDKVLAKVDSPEMARELERIFGYSPGSAVADSDDNDDGDEPGAVAESGLPAPTPGKLELQLGGRGSPLGGQGSPLGGGLGGGGLGGGSLGAPLQGQSLKLESSP
jgi:tetratricopeptide (TPR) repeat protein